MSARDEGGGKRSSEFALEKSKKFRKLLTGST